MRTSAADVAGSRLASAPDFALGDTIVTPGVRSLVGGRGSMLLEPKMMAVLEALARRPNRLVSRAALFEQCWGNVTVGDDSLNRAVAGVRRCLRGVGSCDVTVETVAGTGYVLRIAPSPEGGGTAAVDEAIDRGWKSWRCGLPVVDGGAIGDLDRAVAMAPTRAEAWSTLALTLRNAAEYAEPADVADFVDRCERAAERALALDPRQDRAAAALIGLLPLFGDWLARRARLAEAVQAFPDSMTIAHDIAFLEMAVGRPTAAQPVILELMHRDPLAATLHYKRIYHLWTAGELAAMDRTADAAMHLWPGHPGIWHARFWSLTFSGRARQALQMLDDDASPPLPPAAAVTFRATAAAVAGCGDPADAIQLNRAAATAGPAQAVAAIIHLGGMGAVDDAFAVADSYFLRRGPLAVNLRLTQSDPRVCDQNRRLTQMLFIPSAASLRRDPRFLALCTEIGLVDYWNLTGLQPDFLTPGTPSFADRATRVALVSDPVTNPGRR